MDFTSNIFRYNNNNHNHSIISIVLIFLYLHSSRLGGTLVIGTDDKQ